MLPVGKRRSSTLTKHVVPMAVTGVLVERNPRSDADGASGDREQDLPVRLKPFTDGMVEREFWSSGSAGETIPKTPPPHVPGRPSNKSGRNLFLHLPKDPNSDTCKRTKNHESSMEKEPSKSRRVRRQDDSVNCSCFAKTK